MNAGHCGASVSELHTRQLQGGWFGKVAECEQGLIRYTSLELMLRFETPFRNVFAVRLRCQPEGFFHKSKGFFQAL